MAIGNWNSCASVFLNTHACMGTVRMKLDKETDTEGKKRFVSI